MDNVSPCFKAVVSWPSAPLTESLVRKALDALEQPPDIISSPPDTVSDQKILQWCTYDAMNHDLTYSHPSRVLSSSYVIRKALIRKHYLSRCVHNYVTKTPGSILKTAVPRTWDLEISFADELDELWHDGLWDLGEELEKADPAKWWILKPGMADRGMGIRLFHSKEDLVQIFEGFDEDSDEEEEGGEEPGGRDTDTSVVTSQLRHFVIQEYLAKPVLFDPAEVPLGEKDTSPSTSDLHGHKFHIRVYCVASGALSVFLYTRTLALFSALPYTTPSKPPGDSEDAQVEDIDLAPHLTNTSLQTERGEAGVRLLDELVGCHALGSPVIGLNGHSVPTTRQSVRGRAMGQAIDVDQVRNQRQEVPSQNTSAEHVFTKKDLQDIQNQMSEIVGETFKAALDMSVHFQPLPNAFELYGIDFLVTQSPNPTSFKRYQVQILEVNSEPAIELTGPRLTWVLEDLFKAMARNFVSPFLRPNEEQAWAVGEVRNNLRKCLEVEIRGAGGW